MEVLLRDWEEFARIAQPEDADLDREELRDWADGVLQAIAQEMESPESDAELERQSRRLRPSDAPMLTKAAHVHAMDRLAQGFRIEQIISEYRALRTSVALKWRRQEGQTNVDQLVRFNEALDHALSESVKAYTVALERARDLFTAALGHDLRTPLSSIHNTTETFLLASDQLPSLYVQGTLRIRNATKRVLKILQDLLDFANTRLGGQLSIARQDTNLTALCEDIVDELKAIYPNQEVCIDCEPDVCAEVDPDRIGQLLSNLVSNAIKYGQEGAPVSIAVRTSDNEVALSVHNKGEPIPDPLRSAIFEPLKRGDQNLSRSQRPSPAGLGLGLYIAWQIAEAHDGTLDFRSTADEGTTFEARISRRSEGHENKG